MTQFSALFPYVLPLVVALGLGLLGTYLTREVARRIGFVAKPRAERWHEKPTALAGGVGIFIAFAVTCLWVGGPLRVPLLMGATAMFVLGLIDDVVQLRPSIKLGGQLLVAVLTAWTGPILPWTQYPLVNQGITVFWLVGVTNALNLLDNMDGLSGGVACIGALVQSFFFFSQGQNEAGMVCLALAGALIGFLVFNFNPASIFMGDAGALFLGYTLATLALHQHYGRSRGLLATIAGPVLLLTIPIFDTTFVSITRMLQGRPISQGGRDHTSHRLVLLGLSQRSAVLTIWGLALLSGLIAILLRYSVVYALFLGIPLTFVVLVVIAIHLARVDQHQLAQGQGRSLLMLGALGYRLRIFEALLDALLAFVSLGGAFLLRFDGVLPVDIEERLYNVFPALVATKILALHLSGAYDELWRHAGLKDLLKLARGALLGGLVGITIVSMMVGFHSLSRGALILDSILFTMLTIGARISFRTIRSTVARSSHPPDPPVVRRVLLWGADESSSQMIRQLSPQDGFLPVGFLDDSNLTRGCTLHGLPVLGGYEEAALLLQQGVADEILIGSPAPPDGKVQQLIEMIGEEHVRRIKITIEPVSVSTSSTPKKQG